jgi:hypothetical protein
MTVKTLYLNAVLEDFSITSIKTMVKGSRYKITKNVLITLKRAYGQVLFHLQYPTHVIRDIMIKIDKIS